VTLLTEKCFFAFLKSEERKKKKKIEQCCD
jgi:hypothetical protein